MIKSKCLRYGIIVGAALLGGHPVFADSLQPLSEDEMGAVTGQKGILVSLDYYYNSNPADNAGTPNFNESGAALSGATGCSAPNGTTSLANMNCRFAVQLENRETEWLVFKNGYASAAIKRLSLDGSYLNESRGSGAAYTGWFTASKFSDDSGCLLGASNCNAGYVSSLAALRTHYPETGGTYTPGTHSVTGYDDVLFGMYYEGLAVEPNSAPGIQDGWNSNRPGGDVNGSFLGLNIADNNGYQAHIAIGGDFYLYGF